MTSSLFACQASAHKALDPAGKSSFDRVGYLESLWQRFYPFADSHFRRELNDAIAHLARAEPGTEARSLASTKLHVRFWEMFTGIELMDRGFHLVAYNDRRTGSAGPDHLVQLDHASRLWIECVAPEQGDRVDLYPIQDMPDGAQSVSDDLLTLRLLGALKEKYNKWLEWNSKEIVAQDDAYVIAINDASVCDALDDYIPSRIARAAFGGGPLGASVNIFTGEWSEPSLAKRPHIKKPPSPTVEGASHEVRAVPSEMFMSDAYRCVSAVLYSWVSIWSFGPHALRPHREHDNAFDLVLNHQAHIPLQPGWFSDCMEYQWDDNRIASCLR